MLSPREISVDSHEQPTMVFIARNVIHFSDICYLRTKMNNKSTNCLLWLLEKLINFIGALKHHLLPQADGQHRIPEKNILQAMVD